MSPPNRSKLLIDGKKKTLTLGAAPELVAKASAAAERAKIDKRNLLTAQTPVQLQVLALQLSPVSTSSTSSTSASNQQPAPAGANPNVKQ